MKDIVLLLHNIRSTHNIGSIFRTSDGLGVSKIILSGYTPYPMLTQNDPRLPHIAQKLTRSISKTALGAETLVPFEHSPSPPIETLKSNGYTIVGLEQDIRSRPLTEYSPSGKIALLLGNELDGISEEHRALCDTLLEIPMQGKKESFNVSVAAGIALYHLVYS